MKTFLALDQAARVTGWAYYKDGNLVNSGTFSIPPKMPIEQRLGSFWKHLNTLYDEYEFKDIAFEGIQEQGNKETFKKLAYVQAAILLWAFFNQMKTKEMTPSHWRKVLKGQYNISFGRKREEQKATAQKLVKDKFDMEVPEDQADAICIGLAAMVDGPSKISAF